MNFKNTFSRLISVQIIYSTDISNQDTLEEDIKEKVRNFATENDITSQDFNKKLSTELVTKTISHKKEIDHSIAKHLSKHDSIDKLNFVLKSILRCATCELIYLSTPYKVIIDEYIKITKDFFASPEANFINAMLDKIIQDKKQNNE